MPHCIQHSTYVGRYVDYTWDTRGQASKKHEGGVSKRAVLVKISHISPVCVCVRVFVSYNVIHP